MSITEILERSAYDMAFAESIRAGEGCDDFQLSRSDLEALRAADEDALRSRSGTVASAQYVMIVWTSQAEQE